MIRFGYPRHIILFAYMISALSLSAQNDIRVDVVEFEEKNDIRLQNGGVIIAEWVVTELQ